MKILVAMSGGVDSTVAAYLLKKKGNEVVGVNFDFTGQSNSHDELDDIAKRLGIKVIYRDFRDEFREKIIKSFVRSYEDGVTPNPCAICNGNMKFAKLLSVMREEGLDMIATGHYANVTTKTYGDEEKHCIMKSKNLQKDQSYMLYRLNDEALSHVTFPIGDMDKSDVRKVAKELGLSVSEKKDSQDVCFIQGIDYKEFIKRFEFGDDYREKVATGKLKEEEIFEKSFLRSGEFVDVKGNVLGFHKGIINYTIGQRKGFNIAFGERKFVVRIDAKRNRVVLGDNDDLYSDEFNIYDVVFSGISESQMLKYRPEKIFAKLRYRHDGTMCKEISKGDGYYKVRLASRVRAITSGQSAVFYDDCDRVLFGGIIK